MRCHELGQINIENVVHRISYIVHKIRNTQMSESLHERPYIRPIFLSIIMHFDLWTSLTLIQWEPNKSVYTMMAIGDAFMCISWNENILHFSSCSSFISKKSAIALVCNSNSLCKHKRHDSICRVCIKCIQHFLFVSYSTINLCLNKYADDDDDTSRTVRNVGITTAHYTVNKPNYWMGVFIWYMFLFLDVRPLK